MDFLFVIIVWLSIFALFLAGVSFFISFRNKAKIRKKLKTIDKENKLLAIDELRRIIKKDPHNFEAREKLGDLMMENRSYLPAIKEYMMILDYCSSNPKIDEVKILVKIGEAHVRLQNFEEAKKYFLIAKSKDDLNFSANINLARIEMQNKNYEKAESYFMIAIQVSPEDIELFKPLGICYYFQNKFNQAVARLERYFKERPEDFETMYYLAYSYYNLTRLEDSLKYFSRLKNKEQYAFDSFYMLGIIHFEQGFFNQAKDDFNNALLVGKNIEVSKRVEIQYYLAESYLRIHEIANALNYWKKVAEVEPNYKDVIAKIENYSQVASNSLLETYLVGSVSQFIKICQLFIKYYIVNFSVLKGGTINFLETNTTDQGALEILAEVTSGNFIETYFFVFMRSTTLIGDMVLRNMYNTLKDKKADKGICVTAGGFTDSAKEFVESRMLKIVERDKLIEILGKISNSLRSKNP